MLLSAIAGPAAMLVTANAFENVVQAFLCMLQA